MFDALIDLIKYPIATIGLLAALYVAASVVGRGIRIGWDSTSRKQKKEANYGKDEERK